MELTTAHFTSWLRGLGTAGMQLLRTAAKPVVFALWQSSYDPIHALLNESDLAHQDHLTRLWRDAKIGELATVGYTAALLASVIASAFSWNDIAASPWTVRAVWYGSLALSVSSISIATQQSVALYRIGNHAQAFRRIRAFIAARAHSPSTRPVRARVSQLYIWQIPVMLLNVSITLFLVGLAILVVGAALSQPSVWTDEKKILVAFSVAGVFAAANYMLSLLGLYNDMSNADCL